ncbi:thioredoxin domain-containing protein [Hirsutella rhossiliensis]|uniref:Thioredoxin n=1 Tax=Hirsutella rhossiliensis TaxID=111463 RepID=A0A9P8SFZ0_9HYPO|nr:thioredoxin domain-containing protein [Hirsutella rhossiliensis]KAH0961428.1 thioredoxin domain-containing protein [Hirsutella rhossiliensis]
MSAEAPNVTKITSKAQFDELIKQNPRVAVQAHAEWCGPCKAISPVFDKLSTSATGVTFARFDTDDVPDLSQEFGIRSIPAFFFFKDGNKESNIAGANPKALQEAVSSLSK